MDNNISEPVGNVPQTSEEFGTLRKDAEAFGTLPNSSEPAAVRQPVAAKTENHTMTVREAARAFENAWGARTERSITNWCQLNRQGVSRLDCYFEENDRKYFITEQSIERAIKEGLAKAREQGLPNLSERVTEERKEEPAPVRPAPEATESSSAKLRELELEKRDLLIASRAKDMFIEQLQKDRDAFVYERQHLIDLLIASSWQIGELATKLLQIEAPREARAERNPTVPNTSSMRERAPEREQQEVSPAVVYEHQPRVEHPPSYGI